MPDPRVVVCGLAGAVPVGGMGLHYLQYCLGLRDLGVEVFYLEDHWAWPYHPDRRDVIEDASYTIAWLTDLFEAFDLPWAYMDPHGDYHGTDRRDVHGRCATADLLINLSGGLFPFEHHRKARTLAFVDTDSAFNQVRALTGNDDLRVLMEMHDLHFTFAEAIGEPWCRIPDVGLRWRPTRQPVHLPLWDEDHEIGGTWTTVMNWRSYGTVTWEGETWGQKDAAFPVVWDLPARTGLALEIALDGPAPREELRAAGWSVVDPLPRSRTIWDLQDYIHASRGELTVQKQAFVRSRSGWFAERSANYLAAGRPVVAQDTGWSSFLPTDGGGLFPFSTPEQAADALHTVEADPAHHAICARRIAEREFDARTVLGAMLSEAGL